MSTQPQHLQKSLDQITAWSQLWKLKINPTKSEHIHFQSRKQSNNITTYRINNQIIQHTDTVRDLGIWLSSDLKWTTQTSKIYSKAIPIMYTILRSFRTQDPKTYTTLYKTYVRPIIEYNTCIWSPNLISDIKRIQSIQTKFTRTLFQKLNTNYRNYQHRLELLELESLESRRLRNDLTLVYKFQNNLINHNMDNFFTKSTLNTKYKLRRHANYLKIPGHSKTTIRRNFFSNRIVKIWNKLPEDLVTSKTLTDFKAKLCKMDLSKFSPLNF